MLPCKSLSSVCLVSCLLFVSGAQLEGHGFSCKDQNDNNVDWFAVYKAPIIPDHQDNNNVRDGKAFVYMDANSNRSSWQLSDVPISEKSGHAIANTLQQVYANKNKKDVAYLMYNDQPPVGKKRSNRGHVKGVVLFNRQGGFWMVHSLPKFPNHTDNGYSWPDNGKVNGQVFLCMTYPYTAFNDTTEQLKHYRPLVYDFNIKDFSSELGALSDLTAGKILSRVKEPAFKMMKTSGGKTVLNIAKNSYTHLDIYTYLVARFCRINGIYVQTWRNGAGTKMESCVYEKGNDKRQHVVDVENIKLYEGIAFRRTKDHSKWAVSKDKKWICIGDLNRMESQMKRGGGVVCMSDDNLWKAFHDSIDDYDELDKQPNAGCPEITLELSDHCVPK